MADITNEQFSEELKRFFNEEKSNVSRRSRLKEQEALEKEIELLKERNEY